LSEYNLLYHQGEIWVIDVSQSVEHDHPNASEFLRQDCANVHDFFGKRGVDVLGLRDLFKFVTAEKGEHDLNDDAFLDRLLAERKTVDAVDEAVFRQEFIPRTLNETRGDNVNTDLLAKVMGVGLPNGAALEDDDDDASLDDDYSDGELASTTTDEGSDDSGSEDADSDGSSGDDDDDDASQLSDSAERRRRRRKPETIMTQSKEARKEHKRQVKADKRAKRATKINKNVKKRAERTSKKK
jgi:RIO kinase 1